VDVPQQSILGEMVPVCGGALKMQSYRYYCLDGAGKLHSAEWFGAASDEKAVEFIRA
jgi:hypothetical protein